ncbi:MAG: thioredoxin fold domain-containing protein [Gammaproteobacteria bacterium]|jgi:thiol:disulfide interchange protein DsbC|nr:thioredoxin fold domain-containing protein [Gammaproteobacteria bacterium]MBT4493962.1 thioredoxin fold domain-containing protein [Gammaproteobacteria bacterium]MBT7371577.1 thioredoxin fold domain-containing protein [Gammaproteobacteria bacterium]
MILFRHLRFIFALLPLFAQGAEETSTEKNAQAIDAIEARLLAVRPDLQVKEVRPSTIEGYYNVELRGGTVLYMSKAMDHLFAGDLYLVEDSGLVNATEKARTGTRKELLESLDESEMVVFSPPKERTKATITVFTDIDCSYCRKLHLEVPEMNRLGIAVRYLAYPRAGIGSKSYDKAVSAWCADNPQVALTQAKSGQEIEERTCSNPVAAQYALGDLFGVSGTPAIILEDGTLQPGYLPATELGRRLGIN